MASAPASAVDRDPIIGLDVGGHRPLFYCHVSTLTNGSPYFASRFNNHDSGSRSTMQPGDLLGTDDYGRGIYFVDRNGSMFHYILEYLRNNTVDLPKFQQNPELWKTLRREAGFFGLDGFSNMLQTTNSCSPAPRLPTGDRGILYWLGTDRGRSPESYQNPYMNGSVDAGGWMDYADEATDYDPDRQYPAVNDGHLLTPAMKSKTALVEYRQKVKPRGIRIDIGHAGIDFCDIFGEVFVDLRFVRVRATHYSLRYGACDGMDSDWVFEGSMDGYHWDVLHEATSDSYLRGLTNEQYNKACEDLHIPRESRVAGLVLSEAQRNFMTDWAEKNFRHTWEIPDPESNAFHRFFRIRKVSEDGRENGCLHGTSLEIFGDVNECPED